jgi:hypothetical protein
MSAARIISEHPGVSQNFTSDAVQYLSDEALVAGAKMGHGSVFEELHKRHRERMFRVAHRITRHREDAHDAVQESFRLDGKESAIIAAYQLPGSNAVQAASEIRKLMAELKGRLHDTGRQRRHEGDRRDHRIFRNPVRVQRVKLHIDIQIALVFVSFSPQPFQEL